MAHYLVYFPGARGHSHDLFRAAGLDDLLPTRDGELAPSFADVTKDGPDGGVGVVASWLPTLHPERCPRLTVCQAGEMAQEWAPLPATARLPAGRAWLGRERGRPPTPDDLLRDTHYPGYDVQLADGYRWRIPVARLLPHVRTLDVAENVERRKVRREFEAFYDQAAKYYQQTAEFDLESYAAGQPLVFEGGFRFACAALAINYRLNVDVVNWLQLLDDDCYLPLIGATFELQARIDIEAQKKKADGFITAC